MASSVSQPYYSLYIGIKVQLHTSALSEEHKVIKAKLNMTLRDSEDWVVRDILHDVQTGRRWS